MILNSKTASVVVMAMTVTIMNTMIESMILAIVANGDEEHCDDDSSDDDGGSDQITQPSTPS